MTGTTWRYVLTRDKHPDGQEHWSIRELYLGMGPEGTEMSWTKDPIEASGETAAEIVADLQRMLANTYLPYLDLTLDPPALVGES